MPTSGDTDWSLTAGEVATSAARELGVIGLGDGLEAAEMDEMLRRLNLMFNTWAGEGNLFRESYATLTVLAASGVGDTPIREILAVSVVVSPTYSRPLTRWNRDQYLAIPNRGQEGNPVAFYVEKGVDSLDLLTWPVAVPGTELEVSYSRLPDIITNPDDTLDVPQDWHEAVIMSLASRCASMFGTTRLDPSTVQRTDDRAASLYNRLLDRDRPDSYFLYGDDSCHA